jgi:pentatricopeptide repeat protein
MEAESYSAEDKSCECGREGSTKFCEWCRYDKCEKCFQEMKDECRHCDGQDKTLDGKWCEYCDGGEKYICHENNIPEFDWAVMEPEHPYDTTKEEMGYAAEQKSISPYLWGLGIVGFLGYKFLNKK